MVNAKGVYANARGSDLRSLHTEQLEPPTKKKKKKIAINTNLPLFTHCICNNNVGASGQSKKDDETSCLVFFLFIFLFFFQRFGKGIGQLVCAAHSKSMATGQPNVRCVSRLAILLLTKRRPVGNTYIVGAGGGEKPMRRCLGVWSFKIRCNCICFCARGWEENFVN